MSVMHARPGPAPTPWLPLAPEPGAAMRLYCLPHAGAGPSAYRPWIRPLAGDVALVPVQPPGREARFGEPPLRHVGPLVTALADVLAPRLDPPYALFGHSVGALVAFELARELRRRGTPQPEGVLVAGRPAPQLPRARAAAHLLDDRRFVEELRLMGGMPDEVLGDDELLRLLLPLLRADVEVNDGYAYRDEPPLEVPIVAFAGAADDRATPRQVDAWREQTTGRFELHVLAGGHFFPFEQTPYMLGVVARVCAGWC